MTAEETADFGGHDFSAEEKKQKNKKTHTDSEPEPLNAYQRMLVAQSVIDSMPWVKDMANSQFKSIPIDAMRAGVRKACIRAGLVHVGPIGLRYEVQSRDGRIKVYTGECTFRYVNADDPDDFIEYASLGEAMDTGDKGAGKLVSNLIKTHYKTCFDIGEQGKDDIDSYSNEEMEAEADRIAERRARRQEQASKDRFFGAGQPTEEVAQLRRQVGAILTKGEPWASIIQAHKAEKPFAEWDADTLRKVIAECEAVREGSE